MQYTLITEISIYFFKSQIVIATGYGSRRTNTSTIGTDLREQHTVCPSGCGCRDSCVCQVPIPLPLQSHPLATPPDPPFLELLGGNKASSKVGVPHSLGLPPRRVVLAHHLQDLPALEGQACLLAGDGPVLPWVVVEEGPHEHLQGTGWVRRPSIVETRTCLCHVESQMTTTVDR